MAWRPIFSLGRGQNAGHEAIGLHPRRRARVLFRDIPHCLDLLACQQALIRRQVEGRIVSMESLAQAAGCSRSTASRFFAGRVNNLKTTLLILERLGLQFDEVAIQCGPDDDCVGGQVGQ